MIYAASLGVVPFHDLGKPIKLVIIETALHGASRFLYAGKRRWLGLTASGSVTVNKSVGWLAPMTGFDRLSGALIGGCPWGHLRVIPRKPFRQSGKP